MYNRASRIPQHQVINYHSIAQGARKGCTVLNRTT